MSFDFRFSTDTLFGIECYRDLPALMTERKWVHPGLVVDSAIAGTQPVIELIDLFKREFGSRPIFEARSGLEPDYDYLDESAGYFRNTNVDCLVGVGGGSAMDLCKGICVLMTNPGNGIAYRGMNRVNEPSLPSVLVPSTAGTGSEATFTAVFVDKNTRTKMGINGRYVSAHMALLDAAFTASCPPLVAAAAGLDAMVHALEAFMTLREHPIVFGLAEQAWRYLFRAFVPAVTDRSAHRARLEMLVGAYLAGITLRYSGGGVAGALSYPLGGEFAVPHGIAGGVLLEHIIRQNIAAGYSGYADLHVRLYPAESELPTKTRSERFLSKFSELLEAIGAPKTLKGYPISRRDIPHIVDLTIKQRMPVLRNNPVPVDERYLTGILEAVIPT